MEREDPGRYRTHARGTLLVAHSFKGELFGPAQALHGITYHIEAICTSASLQPGLSALLTSTLNRFDRRNLDCAREFNGENTTCERVALGVWEHLASGLRGAAGAADRLHIVVEESDVAYVEYERALDTAAPAGEYTVAVRGRAMVARSAPGLLATPLETLEGATLVVDACFIGRQLEPDARFLIDICLAHEIVNEAMEGLHQRNLDEHSAFGPGRASCERIAERLWTQIATALTEAAKQRAASAPPLERLRVSVRESESAASEYSRGLGTVAAADATVVPELELSSAPSYCLETTAALPTKALPLCSGAPTATGLWGGALALSARFRGGALAGAELLPRHAAERALEHATLAISQRTDLESCERLLLGAWTAVAAVLGAADASAVGSLELRLRGAHASGGALAALSLCRSFCAQEHAGAGRSIAVSLDEIVELSGADSEEETGGVLAAVLAASEGAGLAASEATPTGITHRSSLANLLLALPCPVHIASAAPLPEAAARLEAAGLGGLTARLVTPELAGPPEQPAFWAALAKATPTPAALTLVAAAPAWRVAAAAAQVSLTAAPLAASFPLEQALLAALGCARATAKDGVHYLNSKRPIDGAAFSTEALAALVAQLGQLRSGAAAGGGVLRVTDLGAGTLSMLPRVEAAAKAAGYSEVHYEAVESDLTLLAAATQELLAQGFSKQSQSYVSTHAEASGAAPKLTKLTRLAGRGSHGLQLRLELIPLDARALADARDAAGAGAPQSQLVVACAFADLLAPDEMLALLTRVAPGALAYLPITFAGRTWLEPECRGLANVPSDARVAAAYHEHLLSNGQHLEPEALLAAAAVAGVALVARGESIWRIPAESELQPYMLDFLGTGTAPALWSGGWDAAGWRARAIARRATVCALNLDVLLRLPAATVARARVYEGLEFVAPRQLTLARREAPSGPLGAGMVELRSITSMVSSGTELLIYRGDFDRSEQALDATIKGMADTIAYPMAYGYSLIGQVTGVGTGVPLSWVGRTAFAFAPHASAAFVEASSLLDVPQGISPADAAFLPAAETALSIVHDAHPRAGELVAVFGAGVIGLLVVAQLRQLGLRVVAFDPDSARLRKARQLGASAAASPNDAPSCAFDVAIECSGNPRALQGAIDATRDHGSVVLASWYGAKDVQLQLGTRFHRSHLKLIASQVSAIPGANAERWSKSRRFSAAWELIRKVRPASSLLTCTMPLARAAEAYAMLDRGEALVCHLSYNATSKL